MADPVASLRALLSMNSAAFERGAKRAQAAMGKMRAGFDRAGKAMRKTGATLNKSVTGPAVAAAGLMVRSSLKTIDAQAKMAQSISTSTESLQVLSRAADMAGLSQGELEGALTRMTRRISLAEQGMGPGAKAFERLGLAAEDFANLNADERIKLIQTRLTNLVPEAERAGVASQIFGDRIGVAIGRLDADTIAAAQSEIKRFGVAVSDFDADQIEAANDAMSALGLVIRGLGNRMAVAIAPALQQIAERIAAVSEWFVTLSPRIQRVIGVSGGLAVVLGPVLTALGFMATGLAALTGPIALTIGGLAVLAGAAVAIGSNWDALTQRFPRTGQLIETTLSGLTRAATSFGTGFVDGMGPHVVPALESLRSAGEALGPIIGNVQRIATAVADLFGVDVGSAGDGSGFQKVGEFLGNLVGLHLQVAGKGIELVARGIEAVTDALASALEGNWEASWASIKGYINWLSGAFSFESLTTSVHNMVSSIDLTVSAWVISGLSVGADWVANIASAILPSTVITALSALWADVTAEIAAWPDRFMQLGRDLIQGLIDGIGQRANAAVERVRGVWRDIKTMWRGETETRSPSRVFARFGQYLMDGLGLGIRSGLPNVQAQIQQAAQAVTDEAAKIESGATGGGWWENMANTAGRALASIASGAQSLGDVLRNTIGNELRRLSQQWREQGISGLAQLFGGGKKRRTSFLGGLFSGFAGAFDGGGRIKAGEWGIAGEKRAEIVTGPAQVVSSARTAQIMAGAGRVSSAAPSRVELEITTRAYFDNDGNLQSQIEAVSSDAVQRAAPSIARMATQQTFRQMAQTKRGR